MIVDYSKLAMRFSRSRSRASEAPVDGTVLGTSEAGEEVLLPRPTNEHAHATLVLGASGTGKTMLIAAAMIDEYLSSLASGTAENLILVDPKGDLVSAILAGLAAVAPEVLPYVQYVNPFSAAAFPFNINKLQRGSIPLEIRAQQVAGICATLSTSTGSLAHLGIGARQSDVLQHLILAVLSSDHPAANITWSVDALTTRGGLAQLAQLARHPRAKAFLANTTLGEELKTSCAARLRAAFCSCEQLERVVVAPTCIDLDALTNPGAIVLYDLGSPPAGVETLISFWSNLLLRLMVDKLMERISPWTGHHTRLVIDEVQIVAPVLADVASRLLTLGRSRGISLVSLSQGTTLIHAAAPELLRTMVTNASTKAIGRLAVADAQLLAAEQAPKQGSDESLSAVRARLVAAITNLNDREFFMFRPGKRTRFTSRTVDVAGWESARAAHADLITSCMNRFALPSDERRVSLAEAAQGATQEARRRGRQSTRSRGHSSDSCAPNGSEPEQQVLPTADEPRRPRSPWG